VYNQELNILLNHFNIIKDNKRLRKEFVEKMAYVIELMNRNQAMQNIKTKARVILNLVISIDV